MKLKQQYVAAALLMATALPTAAQRLNTAYFTEGYLYRHAMNPAFGNDSVTYVAIPALGNVNVKTMGNFGYQDIVRENPLYPNRSTKKMTTFLNPYIHDALDGFSSGKNRIDADVNLTLFSGGFRAWGGYNTVGLNLRVKADVNLPYELFDFARNASNRHYDIGDINVSAQSFAELAFGHSRSIGDQWRVGGKMKLLFGLARADASMKDVDIDIEGTDQWRVSANTEANVSIKGWQYKTKQKDYEHRPGQYEYVNDVDIDSYGLSGFGLAFDLGAEYKLDDNWKFSASLLDLGFIHWSENHYAINEERDFLFDGFHDVSVVGNSGQAMDDQANEYADQIADFMHLRDQGDTGGRTTGIGATLNLAAEYKLPAYDKMRFGLLSSTHINGPYTWTEGRLSANWAPLSWLDGGISGAASTFGASFGWLVNVHTTGFNFFVGMDHLVGKLSKEFIPLSSKASLSLGFNIMW